MNSINTQIACPKCRSTVALSVNGNTLETPLVCQACGQTVSPHFYCPEANSSARHIFTASRLYVDNMGAIYTFCPDHTFTTYSLLPTANRALNVPRFNPWRVSLIPLSFVSP